MNGELIKPSFQTKPYKLHETIKCRDRFQQYVWLHENVYPLDIYQSQGDVVMIFPRNAKTKELHKRWRNGEFRNLRVGNQADGKDSGD